MPARLADVDARAVGHQPRSHEGAGLRRRSQRQVRRHPAAVGHTKARASSTASIPRRNDPAEWSWAFGIGDAGWTKLKEFVENGGTLLAIGSAVETARELLDLPIETRAAARRAAIRTRAAPQLPPRHRQCRCGAARCIQQSRKVDADAARSRHRSAVAVLLPGFAAATTSSIRTIRSPGACRRRGRCSSTTIRRIACARVWRRCEGGLALSARERTASGWLLGEEYLKDQANILSFRVGKGYVVTYGSQIDFRAQPRATFKLIFNGIFHGPATAVTAAQMGRPSNAATNNEARQ